MTRSLVTLLALLAIASCRSASSSVERVRFAELEGLHVRYVDRGEGSRALVFVHGWCCDASVWYRATDDLADWRCLAIDLPGHGGSDKPERSYPVAFLARAVGAVLHDAGVRRAVLVAHSNGTAVARRAVSDLPDEVAGLVIVDGALRSFFDDPALVEGTVASMRAPDWREKVGTLFVDPMLAPMHDPGERARIRALMLSTPQHVAISTFEAICDPAIWTDEPIRVPTLAFMAKAPFWDDAYKDYVRELVPDLTWHEVDGVSHLAMLDAPEEFAGEVRGFLARIGFRP